MQWHDKKRKSQISFVQYSMNCLMGEVGRLIRLLKEKKKQQTATATDRLFGPKYIVMRYCTIRTSRQTKV